MKSGDSFTILRGHRYLRMRTVSWHEKMSGSSRDFNFEFESFIDDLFCCFGGSDLAYPSSGQLLLCLDCHLATSIVFSGGLDWSILCCNCKRNHREISAGSNDCI